LIKQPVKNMIKVNTQESDTGMNNISLLEYIIIRVVQFTKQSVYI